MLMRALPCPMPGYHYDQSGCVGAPYEQILMASAMCACHEQLLVYRRRVSAIVWACSACVMGQYGMWSVPGAGRQWCVFAVTEGPILRWKPC